jgi:hypothetical protein
MNTVVPDEPPAEAPLSVSIRVHPGPFVVQLFQLLNSAWTFLGCWSGRLDLVVAEGDGVVVPGETEVAQNWILPYRGFGIRCASGWKRRLAECNSAIRPIENLRYEPSGGFKTV